MRMGDSRSSRTRRPRVNTGKLAAGSHCTPPVKGRCKQKAPQWMHRKVTINGKHAAPETGSNGSAPSSMQRGRTESRSLAQNGKHSSWTARDPIRSSGARKRSRQKPTARHMRSCHQASRKRAGGTHRSRKSESSAGSERAAYDRNKRRGSTDIKIGKRSEHATVGSRTRPVKGLTTRRDSNEAHQHGNAGDPSKQAPTDSEPHATHSVRTAAGTGQGKQSPPPLRRRWTRGM